MTDVDISMYKMPDIVSAYQRGQQIADNALSLAAQRELPTLVQNAQEPVKDGQGNNVLNPDGTPQMQINSNKLMVSGGQSPNAAKLAPMLENILKNQSSSRELQGNQQRGLALSANTNETGTNLTAANNQMMQSGYGDTTAGRASQEALNTYGAEHVIHDEQGNPYSIQSQQQAEVLNDPSLLRGGVKIDPNTGKPMVSKNPAVADTTWGKQLPDQLSADEICKDHDNLATLIGSCNQMVGDKNLSRDTVVNNINTLAQRGIITNPKAVELIKSLPMGQNGEEAQTNDYQQWANQHQKELTATSTALSTAYTNHDGAKQLTNATITPKGIGIAQPNPATTNAMATGTVRFNQLRDDAVASKNSGDYINKSLSDLDKVDTGPLAEKATFYKGVMTELFGNGVSGDDANDMNLLKKDLQNYIQNNPSDPRTTDYKTTLNNIASGDISTTKGALKKLLEVKANYAAEAPAKYAAAIHTYGAIPNGADFTKFDAAWTNARDPEAMQVHTMPAEQKKDYIAKLSDQQKASLANKIKNMQLVDVGANKPINMFDYIGK